MMNYITNSWYKHQLLARLRKRFEKEDWKSLVIAMTWDEIEEELHVRKARLERLVEQLVLNQEIIAVMNNQAYLLHPEKGYQAAKRQKYMHRIYRAAGAATSMLVGMIAFL